MSCQSYFLLLGARGRLRTGRTRSSSALMSHTMPLRWPDVASASRGLGANSTDGTYAKHRGRKVMRRLQLTRRF